ncbi:MAG: FHA domain-containing protein [Anaerolineae bacterium]|jgi:pSer/pThr/pTyr-binding forkhead associated (FHA) protein|nr:FHA domain-containing protein [Anaerolineae bacterium]
MQLCPHCGYDNYEGVVFCEKCGIALVPVPLATRQFIDEDAHTGTDRLGSDGVLILQVGAEDAPIMVQVKEELVLGRLSAHDGGITYINLTAYGAADRGVSRRHARLLRDGSAIYLMDLNSTNGTHLNGDPLPSGVEQRIRDGDEIMLGRLKVYVYFKA